MMAASAALAAAVAWTALFNGRDLTGWDTWLGIPDKSVSGLELPRDAEGRYTSALGLNVDPKRVFSVVEVDGAPAIRISGEMFGALTGKDEYDDFHLRLEFKWGEKKWPPRENAVRDSGILYYAVGEHGASPNQGLDALGGMSRARASRPRREAPCPHEGPPADPDGGSRGLLPQHRRPAPLGIPGGLPALVTPASGAGFNPRERGGGAPLDPQLDLRVVRRPQDLDADVGEDLGVREAGGRA
jgi:hypothetical protein